ncbi:SIR2 family protein [Rhizohabitans arisaemae]|uniref:SIR2 family protein n=1 Tax=Rhizohabitans arisaemae TaxID=2720610 RepID=UPI0024B1D11D|nr:SIR2 family protein [Rhizohabitans arisaemae]
MIEEVAAGIRSATRPIAVLAGSGVSQSAGVPTGQDLLRELARRRGADAGHDPVAWYLGSLDTFPDYFGMVGDGTDALPDPIFDRPSATPAHRAIAGLAAAGLVGPILTTNLDRLLERALHEAGVPFDVAYELDTLTRVSLDGVVLLKLHGDYQDIGIRHTAPVTHAYHRVIDDLLDRVFAGFDLLVCGWSASWDVPLRRALCRAVHGRVWWLQCGEPSEAARRIFTVRRPTVARVPGSDEGLTALSALLLGTDRDARCGPAPGPAPDSGSADHG